jgi:hypothetical protein
MVNTATGAVNPGIVWCGKYTEFGVAAQIPINSNSGKSVGVLGLILCISMTFSPRV